MTVTRRQFGTLLGASFGYALSRQSVAATGLVANGDDDPLELREGFACRVISRFGDTMSDGYRSPGLPDGMGCFAGPGGEYILMRNHEVSALDYFHSPYFWGQMPPDETYDAKGMGGVTRLVVNPTSLQVESSNLVLTGTVRNCAGGLSPWGWLTCEETVEDNHGYVFICDPNAESVAAPQRLAVYGRFNHEAACVDFQTRVAYLTEDRGDSCFYRFLPTDPAAPFVGRFQALKIQSVSRRDMNHDLRVGDSLAVEWVDVAHQDSAGDDLRHRAQTQGAAVFARGEGLWQEGSQIYFSCTSGGPARKGQIFCLELSSSELRLVAQSESSDQLDMPDNITVRDGKVYLAEDGSGDQFIRVVKPDGELVNLARNRISSSEIAGLCFSPDGQVLFANIQRDGLTVAITGPFADV